MRGKIEDIRKQVDIDLGAVTTTSALATIKVKFLGRKGPIQELMKGLKDVVPEERPVVGKLINDLKAYVDEQCARLEERFIVREEEEQLQREAIDVTLPGRRRFLGNKHLLNHVLDHIIDIFEGMGFSVQYGPHIESEYYNFDALRMGKDHPARDMQDTFYIDDTTVLRTHTTNIQARVMEGHKPPIRIIAPGRAFRNENISARSHVFFHQVDGFYIDKGVTFSDLLGTMKEFLCKLLDDDVPTRFRCSYFPFVEPGVEVDVRCFICNGKGCPVCKKTGWVEVSGAGMVHPEVLQNGGIDPEEYTGYAWGMGLERLVMIKHGIKDIRLFTQNDLRFLRQFNGI